MQSIVGQGINKQKTNGFKSQGEWSVMLHACTAKQLMRKIRSSGSSGLLGDLEASLGYIKPGLKTKSTYHHPTREAGLWRKRPLISAFGRKRQ